MHGSARPWTYRRGFLTAIVLVILASPTLAQDPLDEPIAKSPAERVVESGFDLVFLRTSGLAVLAAGAGMFVPAAWIGVLGGEEAIAEARERFVEVPANYVFVRPLGDF